MSSKQNGSTYSGSTMVYIPAGQTVPFSVLVSGLQNLGPNFTITDDINPVG